ncbi:MAG: endonuclease/exonuclease/phosphatase family protein [Verrucomicrobiaceae bacterium]|nr:MAG: endonuclease/exonuclease/phosphatase family protein [Verrucomicrobiaceae bacterium]
MSSILKRSPRYSWALLRLIVAGGLAATLIAFAGPWHWVADLFAHFRPQYAVLLAAAAIALFAGRRWMGGTVALLGLALNLAILLPHADRAGSIGPAVAHAHQLRVASLNLLQGNKEHEAVEHFIRESGADVVVFQEVSPAWGTVLQRLTDLYPQHLILARKDSKGTALLSKLPLRGTTFEYLPLQDQIGAVTAEVQTEAGPVKVVFGIHSHKPTRAWGAISQQRYFQWLAKRSSEVRFAGLPVVVLGDFNSTPWAVAFRQFVRESQLVDTSRGIMLGATWNVLLPHRLLIDHAFISPELHLVRRQVGPAVGSDHRPLILDLSFSRSRAR